MNDLPASYKTSPGQNPHSYFRNLCIEYKKILKTSKDINLLQNEMDKLINASKELKWREDLKKPLNQEAGEKAIAKVWHEFQRYIETLTSSSNANFQDLLTSLDEIERMVANFDVT